MAISSTDVSLVPRKFLLEQSNDLEAVKGRQRGQRFHAHAVLWWTVS